MSKIFGTDGIWCLVNEEPLTAEMCLKISKSVSFILRKKNNQSSRVVICKDTRLSGYLYEPLVTAGFVSMGMDVILVGPLPTPAVPLMIKTLRADIGVMITASHNTYEYNGLKFFDHHGRKLDKNFPTDRIIDGWTEEVADKMLPNHFAYEKIIEEEKLKVTDLDILMNYVASGVEPRNIVLKDSFYEELPVQCPSNRY